MGAPIRLVTKVREGYWHVWRLPDGSLRQSECSADEYRRLGTDNLRPDPPQRGWVWLQSFAGPVLSSGLQHLEDGDVYEDAKDYLVGIARADGRVEYRVIQKDRVVVDAIDGVSIDDPVVTVRNGRLERT
jgi:hypothetical protein